MPIVIKSLIFVLLLGALVFWFVERLRLEGLPKRELATWRNIWMLNQSLAFILPGIWFYYGAFTLVSFFILPKQALSRVCIYVLLLGSLPMMHIIVPGLGVFNYLFKLHYALALSILVLFPIFLNLLKTVDKDLRLFSLPADKFVVLFVVLMSLLNFRDDTFTNGVRFIFLDFIGLFLPYYVISRSITTVEGMNKFLSALLISVGIFALIAIFETVKHWHIYNHLVQHLTGLSRVTTSEVRGGMLRAAVTFMTPIVLGTVLTIGFGVYLYMAAFIRNKKLMKIIPIMLVVALICTVSRGPWVGFTFLIVVYIWTGRKKFATYTKVMAGFVVLLPVLLMSSFGQKFIDLLPFVGTIRAETVDYRARLFDMASIVVQRNPLFGSTTYIDTPEMQTMIQGEGIVDVVNTYLQVVLEYGWAGLILFIAIFMSLLTSIYSLNKRIDTKNEGLFRLGRSLFSILSTTALIIYTVSSVDYLPSYYWVLFGLSSSYIYITNRAITRP